MEDENVIIENENENVISGTLSFEPLEECYNPEAKKTTEERIAELEEALDMLLNGVTE